MCEEYVAMVVWRAETRFFRSPNALFALASFVRYLFSSKCSSDIVLPNTVRKENIIKISKGIRYIEN